MKNFRLTILVFFTTLAISSCEKAIMLEEDIPSIHQEQGSASLSITTRAAGDTEDTAVGEGRIYIFSSEGICVQTLSTDGEKTSAIAQLSPGTYSIYAVGGSDLARYTLPSQSNATASSVISRVTGKVMDDYLQKSTQITLSDGDNKNLHIILDRKVLCLDDVQLTDIPDYVTQVEVKLESFYSNILLDGTFPESPTESYSVSLTKQEDGTTWKASPSQMLFPSAGNPTITVQLTTSTGVLAFSYPVDAGMTANHHYHISATYNYIQDGKLTCTLSATDWDEDENVSFTLDNDSKIIVYNPVAGQLCNGYYCVSVNATNRTAVLLNKSVVSYNVPADNSPSSVWMEALEAAMGTLGKPDGIEGSWRLPTFEEVTIFAKDANAVKFGATGKSGYYFCMDGTTLKWAMNTHTDSSDEISSGTMFNSYCRLKPVIDIHY